jgi:hypothetical protein
MGVAGIGIGVGGVSIGVAGIGIGVGGVSIGVSAAQFVPQVVAHCVLMYSAVGPSHCPIIFHTAQFG